MIDIEKMYLDNRRHVYGVCLGMTRNHYDAEDITSDVFVKAIRKIDNFRGVSTAGTWLHRIAVNECLNFLTRRQRIVYVDALWETAVPIATWTRPKPLPVVNAEDVRRRAANLVIHICRELLKFERS